MVAAMTKTTIVIGVLMLAGCGGGVESGATARVAALGGSGVTGTVRFTPRGDKVQVEAELAGLHPGKHGLHIHEFGDCSAPDGLSAGGHFNPEGHPHGGPGAASHPGDFGNVEADAQGRARLSLMVEKITIDAGKLGVVGRGLIVHANADDLVSQPVGEAGGRVACGVITAETGETKAVVRG